jgi:hypothetical protein
MIFFYYIKAKYCSFWVCLCFVDGLKNKWIIAWLRSLFRRKQRHRERRFLHYDYHCLYSSVSFSLHFYKAVRSIRGKEWRAEEEEKNRTKDDWLLFCSFQTDRICFLNKINRIYDNFMLWHSFIFHAQ